MSLLLLAGILAGSTFAQSTNTSSLSSLPPIPVSGVDKTSLENVVPVSNASLPYGAGNAHVRASFAFSHPSVLLEAIEAIEQVECTTTSLAITFNETSAFDLATSSWAEGNILFITNHVGNCDDAVTRGFYLTESITSDNESLTITASSSKKDVSSVSEYATISFNTTGSLLQERDINISATPTFEISDSFSLADTVLYEYAPYVTVTADEAALSAAVTFSGVLTYDILNAKLEALYLEVDTALSADLALSVDVNAEYATTFDYAPATLEYSLVDVAGILNLGPALAFSIGVELGAEGSVGITTGAQVAVTDGFLHIDVLDSSASYASNWTPTYDLTLNLTEEVKAFVDPYISLTVEIALDLFDGLLDLSTGLTATPAFINDLELSAAQNFAYDGTNVTVVQPTGSGCEQGLEFTSDFVFNLTAFVTEFYSTTLYTVDVPLYEYCYTWE